MKKIFNYLSASMVCLALGQGTTWASSHREAPLISNDPLADNTDVYAFRSPCDSNKVVLIANYIPFEHPAGGPNWYTFGQNIRYEIHVDNNASTPGDDIIYRFTFKQVNEDPTTFFNIRLGKQNIKTTYTLERSYNGRPFAVIVANGIVPPPNIGPRSIENPVVGLGATSYDALINNAISTAISGEKVFCGPADDPFFVDLGGAFDVGGFRNPGKDGLAKFNCHSICIEVPISTLQKDRKSTARATSILDGDYIIGVYASAYRKKVTTLLANGAGESVSGDWVQVSRLGMPLTNEAVIPIGMKDKWNATKPAEDLQFASYFKNPELALYMDDSQFGGAVPGLSKLRIQSASLGAFDFRNGKKGLFDLKGTAALDGTALSEAAFGSILLPDDHSPRAVDLLPAFYTGVPNLRPYQLATGKGGDPLAAGKPFINNFLPTLGDYLRLNMAVPVTPRNDPKFSTLGLVGAAVLGLTDPMYNADASLQFIPNMDGFPNGRRLEDDVTTIELQAVSGVVLAAIGLWYDDYVPGTSPSPVTQQLVNVLSFSAGITHNDTTFKPCFPYVQAPWRGFMGASITAPNMERIYVDASVPMSGDGSSWGKAYKELSTAVMYANSHPVVKSIWVANGVYKPTTGTNRAGTINITRAGLQILGGFTGVEESANASDPATNLTIVSGDIGKIGDASDNSYHLFNIHNIPASASMLEINGLVFEKGNANGNGSNNSNAGGAILGLYVNDATTVKFDKCVFMQNNATVYGGAVFMNQADLHFTNCSFIANTGGLGGAAAAVNSSPMFIKAVFSQNTSSTSGGAYYGNAGTTTFNKVVFTANSSITGGAAVQYQAKADYFNCIFNGNMASTTGGAIAQHDAANSRVVNSTFFSNASRLAAGAIFLGINNSSTSTQNSIFWKNLKAGTNTISSPDIFNYGGSTNNVIKNNLLQDGSSVPADNGGNVANNIRGKNPSFVNDLNPIGADGKWFTADDGLQLNTNSPVTDKGLNAAASDVNLTEDFNNKPRIACGTVDMGAHESQKCVSSFAPEQLIVDNIKTGTHAETGIVANPFTSELQIRYLGNEKTAATVINLSGKVMWGAGSIAPGTTRVSTGSWSSGIYQVVLKTASGKQLTFKVVKL